SVRWPDPQTPLFGAGSVLMGADDGAVDDQILEVGIVRHCLEDASPHALATPAAEPAEHAVPFAEGLRKIAPRRAGAHDPQHTLDKHAVIAPGRTFLVRPADDQ